MGLIGQYSKLHPPNQGHAFSHALRNPGACPNNTICVLRYVFFFLKIGYLKISRKQTKRSWPTSKIQNLKNKSKMLQIYGISVKIQYKLTEIRWVTYGANLGSILGEIWIFKENASKNRKKMFFTKIQIPSFLDLISKFCCPQRTFWTFQISKDLVQILLSTQDRFAKNLLYKWT